MEDPYVEAEEVIGGTPGARITATADVLRAMLTGQPAFPVFAVGKDRFDYDVVDASLTFERDAAGKIIAVVLRQNGQDMRAQRL